MRRVIAGALAAAIALAAAPGFAQEKLTVWWVKGFYKSEDDALFAAIKKFEAKTGVKVELSQYAVQDMIPKTVAALDSGTPPDVAYADVYDFQVAGKWAFDGKLEDISDVIDPMKDRFAPNTLETTYLYNDKTKKNAYYAFPLKQQTMHIQYWNDMLAEAGFKETDIPDDLEGLLGVLVRQGAAGLPQEDRQARLRHRQADGRRFERLVLFVPDLHGRLQRQAGRRQRQAAGRRSQGARQGLIGALTDYTEPYTKGCTPPSSTSWKDPDNNVAFHNKTTVMTHNATISIAAKWLDDVNNAALDRRAARAGQEELRRADRHRRLPEQAGRHARWSTAPRSRPA